MSRFLHIAAVLLIVVGAAQAAPGAWSRARRVTVVTSEYQFSPARLTFKRGVAYRLHLEDRGKEMHEFHAPAFFKSARLGNPAVLDADRTEIVLHPGEAKDLYFVPLRAGRFPLICPDHDWTGMTGEITVR